MYAVLFRELVPKHQSGCLQAQEEVGHKLLKPASDCKWNELTQQVSNNNFSLNKADTSNPEGLVTVGPSRSVRGGVFGEKK